MTSQHVNLFSPVKAAAPPKSGNGADRAAMREALDELFQAAQRYRTSAEFMALVQFVTKFRRYAPYNAMLIHIQRPGATFVAPAHRWITEYGRRVKTGATPMVILQPMGPVMFVFDVGDTEPLPGAKPLPVPVEDPYGVRSGKIGGELPQTLENARRDGVRHEQRTGLGNQLAGFIAIYGGAPATVEFPIRIKPPTSVAVPLRYEMVLSAEATPETRYATLAHELAHLYCGHLGTPDEAWWPDRRGHPKTVEEFEAEAVSYLVCRRLGLDSPADRYLSNYMGEHNDVPCISLDAVFRVAGLIESMGRRRLPVRKPGRRRGGGV